MKVVKAGPGYGPDDTWEFPFSCQGCGSELLADIKDVKTGTFGGAYCESGEFSYYVECPKCGRHHKIPSDQWTVLEYQEPNIRIARARVSGRV